MYIYFPSDKAWTWEKTREPNMNGWETNDLELRSYQHRGLMRQERYQDNKRSERGEPSEE